jgi:RNA-directed DNA polymerase
MPTTLRVLCQGQRQAQHVKARLAEWLAPRGLSFNEDKARIVRLAEGFDFLGFNVRRYPYAKLLIKLSQEGIRGIITASSGTITHLQNSSDECGQATGKTG